MTNECRHGACDNCLGCECTCHANYIVRGLTEQGQQRFYTGKAGFHWVSENRRDAFTYGTLDAARRKATIFNRSTELHGLRFVAVTMHEQDRSDIQAQWLLNEQ